MNIYSKGPGPIRPETTQTSQPARPVDSDGVRAITPAPSSADRSDKVSISDAGRALAARDGSSTLDPSRASAIRDRVLSGAYDTLEVVDAVARRLLDSGEL